jgi:hypothetical protein
MGIVWSCYKYLVQNRQEAAHGRRRLVEEDLRNPEDAEVSVKFSSCFVYLRAVYPFHQLFRQPYSVVQNIHHQAILN